MLQDPRACSVRSHLHVACLHDSCYSSKEMQLATCLKRVMQTRYPHSTSLGVCICLCPKSGPWGGLQMDWSEVQLLCRGAQDGLLLRCHLSLAGRERAICLCPSLSICIATPDLLLMACIRARDGCVNGLPGRSTSPRTLWRASSAV